jgi:PIN domain nuclease of toxin-antitoxin system
MLLLDTHILIHAVEGGLAPRERRALSGDAWSIAAVSLWEIAKLAQLGRVEVDVDDPHWERLLARIHVWPVTWAICRRLGGLDFRGDPADELIAATSLEHRIPLLTRDRAIRRSRLLTFVR